MCDKEQHPLVSLYGDTKNKQFSLILVIGREPNDPGKEMGHFVGNYCRITANDNNCTMINDDGKKKNVPFWDLSYSLFASTIGMKGMKFKLSCVERNCSPVAYADISPKTITVGRKRERYSKQEYLDHLREILHTTIFERNRVKLIVFSGLSQPAWAEKWYGAAVREVRGCIKGVSTVDVPFFVGNNKSRIIKAFQNQESLTRRILSEWEESESRKGY